MINNNEFRAAIKWMNQITADVMVGIKRDPDDVIKNLDNLASRVKQLQKAVEKYSMGGRLESPDGKVMNPQS